MRYVTIVFDDPLGNLFLNPANAASLTGIVLFTSPTHNSWTNDARQSVATDLGSSRYPGTSATSIPFGAFLGGSNLFGGGLVAHQAYQTKTSIDRASLLTARAGQPEIRDNTENNMYLFGLFGTRCAEGNAAIAGSVTWAQYGAMDGVNLLYPGSVDLSQNGWTVEYKLGAVGTIHERDRLEFLLGRSIARTSHHVTYPVVGFTDIRPNSAYRTEINKDESSEWLLNASYTRTLHRGWRVGAGITVNWKDHPKIPNYGGLSTTLGDLQLMYTLRAAEAARANDILVAPSGELVVNELTLVTHQLALVYSIP